MVAFVLSIGLLIGLMFKRKEHPTNMYLLLAFVSNPSKKHMHVIFSFHRVNEVFNPFKRPRWCHMAQDAITCSIFSQFV